MRKRSKGNKRPRKAKTLNNEAGNRALEFIRNLRHTKGDWYQKPFQLMEWEEKIIRELFGTLKEDGTRQYREAYISTGRKNGKTELAAAIANYCLYADGEPTPEVYTNAGDRDQASLVFNAAASMIEMSAALNKRSKILHSTKRIINNTNNGFLRALSHEAYTKHGYNPSASINDEIHIWPNRDLYDVMKTGTGARRQPLIVNITTAGWDQETFCSDLYNFAKKVEKEPDTDPSFYSAIFELDEKNDDWQDEGLWYKANPSLNQTVSIDFLRSEYKRARENPSFENSFKRLYLNMWTSQDTIWLPKEIWDACGGVVDPNALKGRICYGGLDLATTHDIAAYVLVFPPENGEAYAVLPFFFIPEQTVIKRSKTENRPYDVWVRQGLVFATPGDVIDYNFIEQKMVETIEKYNVIDVGYDRAFSAHIVQNVIEKGFSMVPIGQGFLSMSPPTKETEKLLLNRKINHGNNPVLTDMFKNIVMTQDPAGNLKPNKRKSKDKIDGIVAMIMAIDRALRNPIGSSIYDTGGIFFLEEGKNETMAQEPQNGNLDEERE